MGNIWIGTSIWAIEIIELIIKHLKYSKMLIEIETSIHIFERSWLNNIIFKSKDKNKLHNDNKKTKQNF